MRYPNTLLLLSFFILLILHSTCSYNSPSTASSISASAVSKDQISCTMCSACDNPCQPVPSPPPQPPPISTCSPPPPPAVVSCSPPPPTIPSSGAYYYSPSPPSVPTFVSSAPPPPPPADVGQFYPPPNYVNYPPPPNPILPYFPFYYYNPPPPSFSKSIILEMNPIVYSIFLFLALFCCS